MVQVNVQLKLEEKKINIVDVLKPAEEFVDIEPSKLFIYLACCFHLEALTSLHYPIA